MARYKITLTPTSPFLIGGHQVTNNHYETLDYIPAPNLQGAIARRILESHSKYDVLEQTRNRQPRYYINDKIPEDGCEAKWLQWFRHFSSLQFTDATPFGVDHFPSTTFGCKVFADHPKVDFLSHFYQNRTHRITSKPLTCACGERLQRADGWKWPKGQQVYRRSITRVGLDDFRHVSKDGVLFTMQVGEPYANQDRSPVQFIGYVTIPPELESGGDLNIRGEVVRIGKHLTVGLGRMILDVERVEIPPFPETKIKRWRDQVGDLSVPLQLNSQLPYSIDEEDKDGGNLEWYHQQFTNWLHHNAGAPDDVRVTLAFTKQTQRRHFAPGRMERNEKIDRFLLPGSLFVVSSDNEQSLRNWLEQVHLQGIHSAPYSSLVTIAPDGCVEGESKYE